MSPILVQCTNMLTPEWFPGRHQKSVRDMLCLFPGRHQKRVRDMLYLFAVSFLLVWFFNTGFVYVA